MGLLLENLGDTHWESAEYFFRSRLLGAAADAIRATPFGPGTRRREPVNSTVTIRVRFRLD